METMIVGRVLEPGAVVRQASVVAGTGNPQYERFCNSTVVGQNGGFVTWIQIQAFSTTFSSVARPSCAGYVTIQNG
jgi:hypothetical protein